MVSVNSDTDPGKEEGGGDEMTLVAAQAEIKGHEAVPEIDQQDRDDEDMAGADDDENNNSDIDEVDEDNNQEPDEQDKKHNIHYPRTMLKVNDEMWHVAHYFGYDYLERIEALYNVPPMEPPAGITRAPHDYQLKGAAQMHHLCKSPSCGGMLGDDKGLGKTIQALMILHAARSESPGGISIVVAPMSVCAKWIAANNDWFLPDHRLKALRLNDASVSATEILSGGYDLLIVTYDFVLANWQYIHQFKYEMSEYRKAKASGEHTVVKPERPTSSLFSGLYQIPGKHFLRLVLDETHIVNKRRLQKWKAVKALAEQCEATVMLSGMLAYNKWHAFSAYIGLLRGHPWTSEAKFLHTFCDRNTARGLKNPPTDKVRLLQRCLQAYLIRRPGEVLDTTSPIQKKLYSVKFELDGSDKAIVAEYLRRYKMGQKSGMAMEIKSGKEGDEDSPMAQAVNAQLFTCHPLLLIDTEEKEKKLGEEDKKEESLLAILAAHTGERASTKQGKEKWNDLIHRCHAEGRILPDSKRLQTTIALYSHCVKEFPGEKVVIFSLFLKNLDLIAFTLKENYGIECLRFDGTCSAEEKVKVQRDFEAADPKIPLLITAGSGMTYCFLVLLRPLLTDPGGEGLTLVSASIMIQTEIWWDGNAEKQAQGRIFRQGQTRVVKMFRIEGSNSDIDREILEVQQRKIRVTEEYMEDLTRRHNEGPAFVKLLTELPR